MDVCLNTPSGVTGRSHECIEMQTQTLTRCASPIDSEASKRRLQTHRRSDDETHEAYTTKTC